MINKYSNVPLYSQLKDLIMGKIDNGEFAEDSKIPSELKLCELYNISRPTVRQAIIELTNSGYLYKEKGKGTFVSRKKSRIDIKNYSGFTHSILDNMLPGECNILSTSLVSYAEKSLLQEVFPSQAGNPEFAEIVYSTVYNGEVLSMNTSYIPVSIFPNIIEDVRAKKPSYDILRGKYAFIPAKSKSSLEVGYSDVAESALLQLQPGQPLIHINNILYSKSGQAVEYIQCKYHADKVKLVFETSK